MVIILFIKPSLNIGQAEVENDVFDIIETASVMYMAHNRTGHALLFFHFKQPYVLVNIRFIEAELPLLSSSVAQQFQRQQFSNSN